MRKDSIQKKIFLTNKIRKTFRKKVKRNRKYRRKQTVTKSQNFRDRAFQRSLSQIKQQRKVVSVSPDENLALLKDTNNVISFISKIKSFKNVPHEVKGVFIDLEDIKEIDIGTISLLLSSIKELGLYGIAVEGNLPKNSICEKVILDSGYLEHMAAVSKSVMKSMKISKSNNLLLMRGKEKSESTKVGKCIREAINELTGKPSHYPPIYGMIQEMNGNSVEHAYKKNKHWLLGINHDKINNKMIFTFTDNGYGILRTLKRRFNKKVFDALNWNTDEDILEGVFDKKYNSRFKKQYNRNKGLPVIKKAQNDNKIDNLIVISNNAYIDLKKSIAIKLKNEFSGTFYYWELDLKTYKNGKNIN